MCTTESPTQQHRLSTLADGLLDLSGPIKLKHGQAGHVELDITEPIGTPYFVSSESRPPGLTPSYQLGGSDSKPCRV